MSDQTNAGAKDTPNYLEMSDEEIMNMAPPADVAPLPKAGDIKEDTADDDDAPSTNDEAEGETGDSPAKPKGEESGAGEDDDDDAGEGEDTPKEEDTKAKDQKAGPDVANGNIKPEGGEKPADKGQEPAKDAGKKDEQAKDDSGINYKAEYERILAPFKANGREIQVKSVDDAIQLMQMGANYNKKMAALKPNLKLMKSLENNGLLSEEKINWLIDLTKNNVGAINKLIKDSGVNPMDLDAEKAGDYKQSNHAVNDREYALDTVLDDLKGTTTYNQLITTVGKQWDDASRDIVAANPEVLRVISGHMENGWYERITTEMELERSLGRLAGLSDIEAYREVGDAIAKRMGLTGGSKGSSQESTETPPAERVVPPKPKQVDEGKLKDKRRAASSTKPSAPKGKPVTDVNPLAMSDEEFERNAQKLFS